MTDPHTYCDEHDWHTDEGHAFKGIVAGVCLSVPLWIGIVAAVWWWVR